MSQQEAPSNSNSVLDVKINPLNDILDIQDLEMLNSINDLILATPVNMVSSDSIVLDSSDCDIDEFIGLSFKLLFEKFYETFKEKHLVKGNGFERQSHPQEPSQHS